MQLHDNSRTCLRPDQTWTANLTSDGIGILLRNFRGDAHVAIYADTPVLAEGEELVTAREKALDDLERIEIAMDFLTPKEKPQLEPNRHWTPEQLAQLRKDVLAAHRPDPEYVNDVKKRLDAEAQKMADGVNKALPDFIHPDIAKEIEQMTQAQKDQLVAPFQAGDTARACWNPPQ